METREGNRLISMGSATTKSGEACLYELSKVPQDRRIGQLAYQLRVNLGNGWGVIALTLTDTAARKIAIDNTRWFDPDADEIKFQRPA